MKFGPSIFQDEKPTLSEEGRLQIGVYAITRGCPAPGAVVRVTRNGEREAIVEELHADESGGIPAFDLPAPPVEFSLGETRSRPYGSYDVYVAFPGYLPVMVEGVQVFPGVTACQDIFLRPRRGEGEGEIIRIAEPTLWGRYPTARSEAGQDESASEPEQQTGSAVTVPEYIVVHDGVPSDPLAPNYWLPFKDYVKNVAACEIYPTWPEAAIRAGVLGILSVTLHRVSTDWYTDRGYGFTLTSSAVHDQAFNYGRNTFWEISAEVDALFDTFATREGTGQPFPALACDGRRASHPRRMSRWGAKEMGEKGYDALSILRRFYGSDLDLMRADKIEGMPSPYGGDPLRLGSTGNGVRAVQRWLTTIANTYPEVGKLKMDGIYGQATRQAVKRFQAIFRLPQSGIVDFSTWYSVEELYAAVMRWQG